MTNTNGASNNRTRMVREEVQRNWETAETQFTVKHNERRTTMNNGNHTQASILPQVPEQENTVVNEHRGGIATIVEQYKDKYNIVAPHTHEPAPAFRYRLDVVRVDHDPDHGEVYKVGKKEINGTWYELYALGKIPLERIGRAIGVQWESGDITLSEKRVMYQVRGWYRQPDGTWGWITGTDEIDLQAVEAEIRQDQTAKVLSGDWKPDRKIEPLVRKMSAQETIDILVAREIAQWNKNKVSRAETAAKLRAIRTLGIKSSYTKGELAKPFLIAVVDLDVSREDVQRMIERKIDDLYGGPPLSSQGGYRPHNRRGDVCPDREASDDGEQVRRAKA